MHSVVVYQERTVFRHFCLAYLVLRNNNKFLNVCWVKLELKTLILTFTIVLVELLLTSLVLNRFSMSCLFCFRIVRTPMRLRVIHLCLLGFKDSLCLFLFRPVLGHFEGFLENLVLRTNISGLFLSWLAMTFIATLSPCQFLFLKSSFRGQLRHYRTSCLLITLLKNSGHTFKRRCHSDSSAILFCFIS